MNIDGVFNGVATLITGVIALIIYLLHIKDEKQQAAKIVMMEIREAEGSIKEFRKTGVITDFSTILPLNSWAKYNHLFVRQLDRDELDLINDFFTHCSMAEREVQRLNSYLPLAMEQKAKDLQSKLVELADKFKNNKQDYDEQKRLVLEMVHNEDYWFLPNAPKQKLISYIQTITYISTTTAGNKLKQVAKIN